MYLLDKLLQLMSIYEKDSIEYKIAEYIIYHQKEVLGYTVRDFASAIYTSPAAILRFINKLGIFEYRVFKNILIKEIERWEYVIKKSRMVDIADLKKISKIILLCQI